MSKVPRARSARKAVRRKPARISRPARRTDEQEELLEVFRKAPGKPGSPEHEAYLREHYDQAVRDNLRHNAFVEMSPRMFRAIEEIIWADVRDAFSLFDPGGRIRDNQLAELLDLLTCATALSSALLLAGECAR